MTRKQMMNARAKQPLRKPAPVSRNLAARNQTITHATGPMTRTRATKGTAAMRGGDGKRSLWAAPMTVEGRTGLICHDSKWAATVSDVTR